MGVRINYIDRMKGFLMVLVVLGHIPTFSMSSCHDLNPILQSLLMFRMPSFFFISGFVAQSIPSPTKTIRKIVFYMTPLICVGLLNEYILKYGDWTHLFMSESWNGYWYLFCISFFALLLLIKYLINININRNIESNKSVLLDVLFPLAIYVILAILYKYLPEKYNEAFSTYLLIAYLPFFWSGYLVGRYSRLRDIVFKNYFYSICLFLALVSGILYFSYKVPFFHGLCGISCVVVILHLFKRGGGVSVIESHLEYLGKNTLDIYLFQFFVFKLINLDIWGFWIIDTKNWLLDFVVLFVIAVVISYVCCAIGSVLKHSVFINKLFYGHFIDNICPEK